VMLLLLFHKITRWVVRNTHTHVLSENRLAENHSKTLL